MAEKIYWVKVKAQTNPRKELVLKREQETNHGNDPIVLVWSLNESADKDIVFDATGYFSWLQPVPAGVFSDPIRSYDGKRIVIDVFNPTGLDDTKWEYKLRATGPGPNNHYETLEVPVPSTTTSSGTTSARTVSGGGSASNRPVSNPAIINR